MSLPIAAASLSAYSPAASMLDTPRGALDVIASRGSIAALNPQPLPPSGSPLGERFNTVALNPQPLPPGGTAASFAQRLGLWADDFCGTVPRKLPPPPVPGPVR
jgi:hypothetical protein